jgi:hypothetical protein
MPVGDDLPGHMLEQAFWPAWVTHHPLRHVSSWELPPAELPKPRR